MNDRELDDAIDRAVRDIMSPEPRAGFCHRVLHRLAEPRRRWFTVPRLAAAVTFAAAVIAFVLVDFNRERTRPSSPAARIPQVAERPTPAQTPPAVPPVATPTTSPDTQSHGPLTSATSAPRTQATDVRAASTVEEDDMGLAPLDAIDPISVPAIAQTRLVTHELTIGELRVAPLTIQLLPPGSDTLPGKDR